MHTHRLSPSPWISLVALAVLLGSTVALPAQQSPEPVVLDSAFLAGYQWRNLGPDRGGRSIAVSGVPGRPDEAYFGAVGGGLWKTTNGGDNWAPVTDFQVSSASVGAVAVSETNPDLVILGMGETCIRGNIMPGDGIYRSRDAGETWEHIGFRDVDAISKIRIHPSNPDVVFAAVFGKYSVTSEERGVYKSTDGGDTWRRVLYRDAETGAIDIVIDRNNPDVIYAALWQAYRREYTMSSGGPGSGLFKSTDGGESWTEITRNDGLPQDGVVGRIGVAVSGANSMRVYALVENDNGGLFKSDDAGASWELVNDDRAIRQRAFYYTHVFADHHDEDVVYMQNTSFFRSTDGGETYESINNGTHGDFHDLWLDAGDPDHLVVGNDGGGAVSFNTGGRWTPQDFSTAQFYHAVTTAHVPFHVCGSQQDNSTLCLPSNWNAARLGFGSTGRTRGASRSVTEGSMNVAYRAGGGEPGYIAPDPKDPDLFYSGTNNGRYIDKYNRRFGTTREVNPYPWFYSGEPALEMAERWQWTFPLIFSPLDPNVLYTSSNRLWKTSDGGNTWDKLSPDLTRADPTTLGHSGGPITGDMNGPEVYATIFSVGPGKVDMNVIWTGSDDGLVHVTRDGGETWTDVTPPDMPDFGRVSQIDASAFDAAKAYVSVRRPLLDDRAPYIWKSDDYGRTWTKIVGGIRNDAYVHAVREDPNREGLLYAATQHGVYISYDDGDRWQELNPELPDMPIVDLIVEHNELAVASHGRGFWVLDNMAPIRQAVPNMADEELILFDPPEAYRSANGVTLSWWLADAPEQAKLEILDERGGVLRTYVPAPEPDSTEEQEEDRWAGPAFPAEAGLNFVHWDLKTQPAATFPGMILWGVRTMAPTVPPGRYAVRLTADGHTATTQVDVKPNPWITDISAEDMEAQYTFRMKAQLENRIEQSDYTRLAGAAERLTTRASDVEAGIYQVRNRSNQDPLNFPIKVNNRLANLLSMVDRGDGRPNDGMRDVFQIMVDELRVYTDRLQQIWEADLAAVNRELDRLGMVRLDPWDEETELTTP